MFRACAADVAAITYSPSAIATSAAGNRTVLMVMVRAPLFAFDDASVPRTSSSRPLRHSPEDVSWSAFSVNTAATAAASPRSRAAT